MQASIWRAVVALCDWRTWLRILQRNNQVDVVFIANLRDNVDRQRYIGDRQPTSGHVAGARINIKGVIGRTRFIDVDANELLSPAGRRKAKKQFIAAVQWASDHGTKVALLAASTKRLFGHDGVEIMEMFPHIVFTIGDNGTAYLLTEEVLSALRLAKLNQQTARVAVLGPYGILGQAVVQELVKNGYHVLGIGSNTAKLAELQASYGIEIATNIADVNEIDIVVACTHSKEALLTSQAVQKIKRSDKKLIVIDVAEPSNFTLEEYQACQDLVIRQDAGNAYSENLKFVLGGVSYRMLRLTNGVVFGCFAEALSIGYHLKNGGDVQRNWFTVDQHNMEFTREMFKQIEFVVPQPRCFEKMLTSFEV